MSACTCDTIYLEQITYSNKLSICLRYLSISWATIDSIAFLYLNQFDSPIKKELTTILGVESGIFPAQKLTSKNCFHLLSIVYVTSVAVGASKACFGADVVQIDMPASSDMTTKSPLWLLQENCCYKIGKSNQNSGGPEEPGTENPNPLNIFRFWN